MLKEVNFFLPVGYTDKDGNLHREGKMRMTTALDEIEIHEEERFSVKFRNHDILLFSRVITSLGDISPVTPQIIKALYEVDFRYLQTLYQEINSSIENRLATRCPNCNHINKVNLNQMYKNLEFYLTTNNDEKKVN